MIALVLPAVASVPARAQVRVRLEMTASDPINERGVRWPLVKTPNILRDNRWREALQNSFPLRLRFRVEIWRVRQDWFDALERSFQWETVVRYEPLLDQYSLTRIYGGSARAFQRFPTLQDLEREMDKSQQIGIAPAGPGEYYFTGTLQIRTLTDEEMEELERFLEGEPSPDEPHNPGSPIGRAARRLLLRFGGLPAQDLEAKSGRFEVRGQ